MKRYIYTGGNALVATKDNFETIETIRNTYPNIDWMWRITEDGELTYYTEKIAVKKGDIVLCLYSENNDDRIISVVNNAQWFNSVEERERAENMQSNSPCEKCTRCQNCQDCNPIVTNEVNTADNEEENSEINPTEF